MSGGYNWFLIIITVVVAVLAVLTALYLLVHYQHPEDKNQAWFPKAVVIFGITLAIWTILLFPLDAGRAGISLTPCGMPWRTSTIIVLHKTNTTVTMQRITVTQHLQLNL
jgi:NO-binding membrane sensor protein with MHYT domain